MSLPQSLPSAAQPTSGRSVVLITGALGGIGRATTIAFAQTGKYDMALSYNSTSPEKLDNLTDELHYVSINMCLDKETKPLIFRFIQADLGSYDDVRRLHQATRTLVGEVDVLFNNAGTVGGLTGVKDLSDVPIDIFESSWKVNTGSPILLTQLCLPHMEAQGWGRVIFNSSVAAFTGGVVGPHYASSKSAVHGFVHWLAGNVSKKGITVNGVAPALIEGTAMLPGGSAELASKVPVGRLGKPQEIADTVMWMVNTGYVTNKIITVDGGMYSY